jgi:hypothetical protein
MKILIKESQYKILLEQSNPNIQKAYNEMVNGAKYWMGTDKTKILNAFNYVKNIDDFKILLSMFKDKRTGYGSFEEMMNKEYDMFDFNDLVKLKDKLSSIGVILLFNIAKNNAGQTLFDGGTNISYGWKNNNNNKCKSTYPPILKQAQDYWRKWLSNPITKQKFKENWNNTTVARILYDDSIVDGIFKRYLDAINKLKLVYYDNTTITGDRDAYAFVNASEPDKIYVNCSENDPDPYGSLIHEIQHILYYIKPLNPVVQIGDVFVNPNTKKSTIETFFDFFKTSNQQSNKTNNLNSVSKQYNTPVNMLNYFLKPGINDPGYSCRETEKMSNIVSVRKTLGVNPGQNITKEMLFPYIKGEKDNTDIYWLLSCWALNGFPDLGGMLNKMNQLAYQNTSKDSKTKLA